MPGARRRGLDTIPYHELVLFSRFDQETEAGQRARPVHDQRGSVDQGVGALEAIDGNRVLSPFQRVITRRCELASRRAVGFVRFGMRLDKRKAQRPRKLCQMMKRIISSPAGFYSSKCGATVQIP